MRLKRLRMQIITSILLAASLCLTASAYDGTPPASADIIYLVDASGSVEQTDPGRYVRDALKLGVDLAPENARVAVIAVNTELSATELTDVSAKSGREELKSFSDALQYRSNTDFITGFERALEAFEKSGSTRKRIIFLGDFSEGGYNLPAGDNVLSRIDAVSSKARDSGIVINMILWKSTPGESSVAARFLEIPRSTGGTLAELTDPSRIPACIEEIYFQNYDYRKMTLSVRGKTGQNLTIPMPTANVRRARIYVSAQEPPADFGASYAGANLDGEENRSYSMIDLANPSPDGISLTLIPGASGAATVYTLLEYDPLKMAVSVHSEWVQPKDAGAVQNSVIRAEIVDAKTGTALLTGAYGDRVSYKVDITSPGGKIPVTYDPASPTAYSFSPALPGAFGTYRVTGELTVDGVTFGPLTESVQVPDIRPVPDPPLNWPLIIAITIGGLFILSALFIAVRIRKKEVEYQGAIEMASDYRFHGKLSVYAVMLDGGERELRPFDFGLHMVGDKKITLRNILDSVGTKDAYPGAENILFLVGPEESVIVRNNSRAMVKIMGRNCEYRSKAQLFYGQKCYIVFDKDENELEVSYRKVAAEEPNPVRFHISGRTVHAENAR